MYMWVLDSKYRHSQLIDSRTCVRICHRVLWYLQKESIRLGTSYSTLQRISHDNHEQSTTGWNFGRPCLDCWISW